MLYLYVCIVLFILTQHSLYNKDSTECVSLSLKTLPEYHRMETVKGNTAINDRIVVYRQLVGGFSNCMLGLVTAYITAIILDRPLCCESEFSHS